MAIKFSVSILVVFTCLRWCSAGEEQSVSRAMNQLKSILTFLPRAQKCDKFLFELMKECVNEITTVPAPTTTLTPEFHEELPVTLKTVSRPSAPADDEDSKTEGSGFILSNALPLKEYQSYRLTKPRYSIRKSDRKTNRKKSKSTKNKRLLKLKKVHLKRKMSTSRKKAKNQRQIPTYSTLPENKVLPPAQPLTVV